MNTPVRRCAYVLALLGLGVGACSKKDQPTQSGHGPGHDCPLCKAEEEAKTAKSGPLDLVVKSIDGNDVNLADYKGKVVLIVNVASKCGFTSQYKGLQKLYSDRKDKGLVILGFPSNDFGGQEPGSEADIKAFCSANYGVDFPMFAKVSVKGEGAAELFKRLAAATPVNDKGEKGAPLGAPGWNFAKYLIDRHGDVVAKFDSKTGPDEPRMLRAIDAALSHTH